MKTHCIIAITFACLAGCSAPSAGREATSVEVETPLDFAMPPESNILEPGKLPTPYSADQIRDANPPGSWKVYRITASGRTLLHRFMFKECRDPSFGAISVLRTQVDGTNIGTDEPPPALWTTLQAHASFDKARAIAGRDRLSLKAGEFDCWTYVVDGADGALTFYWFATELPGPPVLMETRVNGTPTLRMELEAVGLPEAEPKSVLNARGVFPDVDLHETYAGTAGPERRTTTMGESLFGLAAFAAAVLSPNGRVTNAPSSD